MMTDREKLWPRRYRLIERIESTVPTHLFAPQRECVEEIERIEEEFSVFDRERVERRLRLGRVGRVEELQG